jgi:hypothetical protein
VATPVPTGSPAYDWLRWAVIVVALVPVSSCAYRPTGIWLLPIVLLSCPILLHQYLLFRQRALQAATPNWRNWVPAALCFVALPMAATFGVAVESIDFRFRRMAIYERVVGRLERGDVTVGDKPVRLGLPPALQRDALAAWARRDAAGNLRVEFGWWTAGYAGGGAYVYCRGANCETDRRWRRYVRINDRWLRASNH